MSDTSPPVEITAVGAVASLGHSWIHACAAARAGLTRASELDFKVVNEATQDSEQSIGHALPTGTTGFEGIGRVLRIAQLALTDLRRSFDLNALPLSDTGLVVVLPDPGRSRLSMGIEGVDEEDVYPNPLVNPDEARLSQRDWLEHFRRLTGLRIGEEHFGCVHADKTGVLEALHQASTRLDSGEWNSCVLIAVDSLLDPATLQWLLAHRRLKCESNPVGLQPGEAGACLVLQPADAPSPAAARPLAVVEGVARAMEEQSQLAGRVSAADGLLAAISQLHNETDRSEDMAWVISDMNGEIYPANELGNAVLRIQPEVPRFGTRLTSYPASSFGDTGAASAALAVLLAVSGFERAHAPTNEALILSSGLGGERAAALLTRPEARS